MSVNPATKPEHLNSPLRRANDLNDPQFENQQGYFPYDLTHQEYISPLFGQITPTMHLDTVPADRFVVHDNVKTILNQINGNFLSQVNQYVDSFYVPLRSVFPVNYEKLIPNPTKGIDLPNSALPQVPFAQFILDYLLNDEDELDFNDYVYTPRYLSTQISDYFHEDFNARALLLGRLALLATVLSRGQLLDYLGVQFDVVSIGDDGNSQLQQRIDEFLRSLYIAVEYNHRNGHMQYLAGYTLDLKSNILVTDIDVKSYDISTLSHYRSSLMDIFEAGRFPWFEFLDFPDWDAIDVTSLYDTAVNLIAVIRQIFGSYNYIEYSNFIADIDSSSSPFENGQFINIGKVLAYQQSVAQFYTNDSVDNVFNSDLFMQLLRGVMFPSDSGTFSSREPVFLYNGVQTEYDYISTGAFAASLLTDEMINGHLNRQYMYMTILFLLRRSLRYGDYFSTARPRMLAVGQLSIAVDERGLVSPVDVTQNLLKQRYLNAANYIGSGFMQYMSSIHGVVPSDTGTKPRFISHRKISLQNQITNNTANEQGKQTTNLVGYADNNAFDVFIDDFGFIISMTSYDVLPVYTSGIENTYHFADRFDFFNPMLQGIGDQGIRLSEIIGKPSLRGSVFGYTMRNSEYKYKLSKAHGAFVNSLPGFMLRYPLSAYVPNAGNLQMLRISSDFIRDKPFYLDRSIPVSTGVSPAEYFHFICACVNEVHAARKIQTTPPVLF